MQEAGEQAGGERGNEHGRGDKAEPATLLAALREKLSLPWLEEWSTAARTVFINALFLLAVVIVLPVLVAQFRRDEVVIEPIEVPQALVDQGMTPNVAASRIWDGMHDVKTRAATSKEVVEAIPSARQVEFSFPDSGFSIESLVFHVRRLFHAYETRVGGEFVCATPACERAGMQLRLRVIRDDEEIIDLGPMGVTPERDYFDAAASKILAELDPFVAIAADAEARPVVATAHAWRLIRERHRDAKWAFNLIGLIRARSGDLVAAIPAFRDALSLDRNFLPARANLGNALLRQGKTEEAAKELDFVRLRDPENTAMLQGLAELSLAKGDAEGAVKQLMKAAGIDPRNPIYLAKAGRIELERGRKAEGQALLQKALDADPADPTTFTILTASLMADADTAGAEKVFRTRADYLPDDAEAQATHGQMLALLGQWEAASQRYERALALDPQDVGFQVEYARCLQRLDGRQAEALAVLETARGLQSGRADIYFALGDTLRALGRKTEAIAAYRRFLDLEKANAVYRDMAAVWIKNLSG